MTSTSSSAGFARPGASYANQGVVIRGDASLAYQDLADVLSACDEAGIRNVRLPVRSREAVAAWRILELRSENGTCSGSSISGLVDAFWAVINLSPETINQYAEQPGAVAVRRFVRDHLRRDGARGDAVSAGRFAVIRGGGRRGRILGRRSTSG